MRGKEEREFQGGGLMKLRKTVFNKKKTLIVYIQNAIQKPNSKLPIISINHHS